MGSILLVSSNEKSTESLYGLIRDMGDYQIVIVKTGAQARQIVSSNDFDLVVINTCLSDEFGTDLAEHLMSSTSCGVILIVKTEQISEISYKFEKIGVLVIPKPISKQLFYQVFKIACTIQNRLIGLKNENNKLKVKINEIRLVDRAKCILIQYLGMTEPTAHRYIEKQAMDMRISRKQVAESILKTYEQ